MSDTDNDEELEHYELQNIGLSQLFPTARSLLPTRPNNALIEDTITSYILSNYSRTNYWLDLRFDAPLRQDELDEKIYDALLLSERISQIFVPEHAEASWLPRLFARALQPGKLPNFSGLLTFHQFPMTGNEAEALFAAISQSHRKLSLYFPIYYDQAVTNALANFIRTSSVVHGISLVDMNERENDWGWDIDLFQQFCQIVSQSEHLKSLVLWGPIRVVHNGSGACIPCAQSIATLFDDSSSLTHFQYHVFNRNGPVLLNSVREALGKKASVRNFDLTFRDYVSSNGDTAYLKINRNVKWKTLMNRDDIPLELWSLILQEANEWTEQTSHSSLDALYFLVREKNGILLQNVKKRKRRKRRRFQFS